MKITSSVDADRRRSELSNISLSKREASKGKGAEQINPTPNSFQKIMDEVLPPQNEKNISLNRLWKDLPQAERDLLDQQSQTNLEKYRKLIMQIAKTTIKKNTVLKKIRKKNKKGEWIELSVLSFIDKRLEDMVVILHSEQNSAFSILKAMEEIRGILVDISH